MPNRRSTVIELRQYTLHAGRRDELIDLFEREFVEPQEAVGAELIGLFRDAGRPERFVWLRGFAGMDVRNDALGRFYGGPVWKAHSEAANATMIDSDNVLLLRPTGSAAFESAVTHVRAPLLCLTYSFANDGERDAFAELFATRLQAQLESRGAAILATFVTEPSANTYTNLPIREGEHVFVAFTSGISLQDAAAHGPEPAEAAELVPTARSRIRY